MSVMSVPEKYRKLGDFHEYYSGRKTAPYLTIFVGGNHEAASHLWELYYGGWAAPNIYYLGAANVVRLGPLRIAGVSGIWKGADYQKTHLERLPFSLDYIRSFYHVREIDVRKLLQLRTQVDIAVSHDWPRDIERHGNLHTLLHIKPHFRRDIEARCLGSTAAEYLMDRLRPPYWFSAHMHCKFSAIKTYPPSGEPPAEAANAANEGGASEKEPTQPARAENPDEIDLDLDEDETTAPKPGDQEASTSGKAPESAAAAPTDNDKSGVSEELRAQLPASFRISPRALPQLRRWPRSPPPPEKRPGQPVPATITNQTVRFLALDKCLPGRRFLQLCEVFPFGASDPAAAAAPTTATGTAGSRYKLQYDPEWLAITRAFADSLIIGDRKAKTPPDLGEEHYRPLIDAEREWVEENIVKPGKLDVPENFVITAPPHAPGDPEITREQPDEYTNPQTETFCALVGVPNLWAASDKERSIRKKKGPPASHGEGLRSERNRGGGGRGSSRGGGSGRGRGGFTD